MWITVEPVGCILKINIRLYIKYTSIKKEYEVDKMINLWLVTSVLYWQMLPLKKKENVHASQLDLKCSLFKHCFLLLS